MAIKYYIPAERLNFWEKVTLKTFSDTMKKYKHASLTQKISTSSLGKKIEKLSKNREEDTTRRKKLISETKRLFKDYYRMQFYVGCKDYEKNVKKPFEKIVKDTINPLIKKGYLGPNVGVIKDINKSGEAFGINLNLESEYYYLQFFDKIKSIKFYAITHGSETKEYTFEEFMPKQESKRYNEVCDHIILSAKAYCEYVKSLADSQIKKWLDESSKDSQLRTFIDRIKKTDQNAQKTIEEGHEFLNLLELTKTKILKFIDENPKKAKSISKNEIDKLTNQISSYKRFITNLEMAYPRVKNAILFVGNTKQTSSDMFVYDLGSLNMNTLLSDLTKVCIDNKNEIEVCSKYQKTIESISTAKENLDKAISNYQKAKQKLNPEDINRAFRNLEAANNIVLQACQINNKIMNDIATARTKINNAISKNKLLTLNIIGSIINAITAMEPTFRRYLAVPSLIIDLVKIAKSNQLHSEGSYASIPTTKL